MRGLLIEPLRLNRVKLLGVLAAACEANGGQRQANQGQAGWLRNRAHLHRAVLSSSELVGVACLQDNVKRINRTAVLDLLSRTIVCRRGRNAAIHAAWLPGTVLTGAELQPNTIGLVKHGQIEVDASGGRRLAVIAVMLCIDEGAHEGVVDRVEIGVERGDGSEDRLYRHFIDQVAVCIGKIGWAADLAVGPCQASRTTLQGATQNLAVAQSVRDGRHLGQVDVRRSVVVDQVAAVGCEEGRVAASAQALAQSVSIADSVGRLRVVGAHAIQEGAALAGAGATNDFDIVFEHKFASIQITDGQQTDRQISHADDASVSGQRSCSECDDCCDGRQFQFHLHTPVEKEEARQTKQV